MKRLRLANTPLETSVLGYGCVSLTTHANRRDARALLELAYDRGITHFDTARVYGQGQSEAILGEFISDKRDRVTIATKFGLQSTLPGRNRPGLLRAAKSFLRKLPTLEKYAKRRVASFSRGGAFTVFEARASLEVSLRQLKTDYVDVLLLHEATPAQAANEQLVGFLEREVSRGTVRTVGIGSDYRNFQEDVRGIPASYRILQFANSAYSPTINTIAGIDERTVITHSPMEGIKEIWGLAKANPSVTRAYRDRVAADLTDSDILATLALQYALQMNPAGMVLFGTMRREHLLSNVRGSSTAFTPEQVNEFGDYVRQLRSAVQPPEFSAV